MPLPFCSGNELEIEKNKSVALRTTDIAHLSIYLNYENLMAVIKAVLIRPISLVFISNKRYGWTASS